MLDYPQCALTSVVGKVINKIISFYVEEYLNGYDANVQKGPPLFFNMYFLSAILQDAISARKPIMITFLDLKNTFGSVDIKNCQSAI